MTGALTPEAAPLWPLAGIAGIFLVAGAAIMVWPRPLIRFYIGLLRPMRGLFGQTLIDWEIGLMEGKAAAFVVRLFGAFVILAGASVLIYRMAG